MKIWPFPRKIEQKSLAAPEPWLEAIFGSLPTASGQPVTADQALRVPAVGSAIRVISEAIACLDVSVKTIAGDGTEADDKANPVLPLLRDEANDWTSGYELIRNLAVDALTSDVGGLAYVNRVNGTAQEIIRYRPGVITVIYDPNTDEPTYRLNNRIVPAQDVIHLRAPFGRAPLTLAREAIGVALTLELHAARLFGRGARPSGYLKFPPKMGEESVKRARAAWRLTHEGDDTGGRTAILYDGAEFEAATFASTDAQFLENRKFQITEIARAFRVPPSMLFDLDRATWGNTEQMGKEFLTYCLEPWLKAMEGALRRALFLPEDRARFAIRFDRDDLTRADLATRATVINSLISSRVLNPNEGRNWLGLAAREGGDEYANPNTGSNQPVPPVPEDKEPTDAA